MRPKRILNGLRCAMSFGVLVALISLLVVPAPAMAATTKLLGAAKAEAASPVNSTYQSRAADRFCANSNCTKTRQTFLKLCDFVVKERSIYPTIYIGGYYMRDLVAGYAIFGDRKYLNTAIAYADYLLKKQRPDGF